MQRDPPINNIKAPILLITLSVNTRGTDMDRFVFQQGASSFMAPMGAGQLPMIASGATRFMSKPKAEKKSHSEAESRRRKRINDHLVTLRGILPSKVKTDKATLLMETVQHVKELQQKLAGETRLDPPLPTESDAVSVSRCENEEDDKNQTNNDNNNNVVVKATVCCEDRAGLNRDLVQLIRSVRGNLTRTEMATVGGRTKVVMTLKLGLGGGGEEEIGRLRKGLRAVVENTTSGHLVGIGPTGSNKRGRFVMPNRTDNAELFVGGASNFSLRC